MEAQMTLAQQTEELIKALNQTHNDLNFISYQLHTITAVLLLILIVAAVQLKVLNKKL